MKRLYEIFSFFVRTECIVHYNCVNDKVVSYSKIFKLVLFTVCECKDFVIFLGDMLHTILSIKFHIVFFY